MELKDFETLLQAQEYTTTKGRMISPDMMVAFLAMFGIGRAVEVEDTEAAFAFRKALQFGSEFNLMSGHSASVETLLHQIQAATPEFKNYVISYANPISNPFKSATQAQFNMAKGLYKLGTLNYVRGKSVVLTLNTNLAERAAATVWITEIGFETENAGRSVYIQSANKYRIDMSGKKSGNYEIRIPLLDADFTVELI